MILIVWLHIRPRHESSPKRPLNSSYFPIEKPIMRHVLKTWSINDMGKYNLMLVIHSLKHVNHNKEMSLVNEHVDGSLYGVGKT